MRWWIGEFVTPAVENRHPSQLRQANRKGRKRAVDEINPPTEKNRAKLGKNRRLNVPAVYIMPQL